ncbi:hypothetical protein CWE15_10645 [Aliidiomarina taiwanensis]|uniref:Methyltransferase type 11 domain-containing protein n=1 Tax=Aliidiomarina taiwanensis TaxID=946228 RepID=A0A432WW49_9GAMM|nr:class I SAM-dependent methyltransferase [Aliidiomarina taiwanensis]RUO37969.1 hypothetical protein CWE15_10645 [Aliidiomarina taiwanensis]
MKHWSQFWRSTNSLSSFSEGIAVEGYSAEIKEFWETSVAELGKNAVLVDIGTGNGALAVLMNDYSKAQKLSWQIHGVDAAEIKPKALEESNDIFKGRFDGIEFHPETDMAKMPFEDASVDCVVSQFAFEYGDESAVLAEIMRVLKPGGRFVMMGHHKKSAVHKSTDVGVKVLHHIMHETPLFAQAELYLAIATQALTNMDARAYQGTNEGQAIGRTVEWLLQYVQDKYKKEEEKLWVTDVCRRVINLLAEATTVEKAKENMRQLNIQYQLLTGHIDRLKDMSAASRTETQIKKLVTSAKKLGAEGDYAEMKQHDDVFAWTAQFVKQ